ncbi:MAG TPA: LTA synthase family protein [Psychromonas hadalis]|nr:LTA synthase family protein [Psychromonas hadalis]
MALNQVTPNALMLLDWAYSDYKEKTNFTAVNLSEYDSKIQLVTENNTTRQRTPHNDFLKNNPPNVVLALMESMGTLILNEDSDPTNDLLGELRSHFDNDFLFTRFYAETSATIDTLMEILVHSNVPTISHSIATKKNIPENAMRPYKRAGYETVFIYGGNAMWRNLGGYLPHQDFDLIYDENNIYAQYPEAKSTTGEWGVADEYLFKYAQYILEHASKPIIITLMTVTNHSPHHIPATYTALPVKASEQLSKMESLHESKLDNMLETYQYAANSLGDFITQIKHSKLAHNTIIVATGDHRSRSLTAKTNQQLAAKSQIPFYLYIPKAILNKVAYKYEQNRAGSHKDIFPTLYHFSLSEATYTSLGGTNILSQDTKSNYWGWSQEGIFDKNGARLISQKGKILPWKDKSHFFEKKLKNNSAKAPFSHKDYRDLKTLFINKSIAGFQSNLD